MKYLMISITMRYFDLEQTSLDDKISHKTLIREILNQVNLNQISHKTFNREILNHINLNQISHKTFKHEIFNQTNFNQISHKVLNHSSIFLNCLPTVLTLLMAARCVTMRLNHPSNLSNQLSDPFVVEGACHKLVDPVN